MHQTDDDFVSRDVILLPIGVLPEVARDTVNRRALGERVLVAEPDVDALHLVVGSKVLILAGAVAHGHLDGAARGLEVHAGSNGPGFEALLVPDLA